MTELEFLYQIKRDVEDRIDSLAPAVIAPPIPIEKRRLALIVGHTARSPGAYSKTLDQSEYFWNRDLAQMIETMAGDVAVSVFFRDHGGVSGAYETAREWDPDAIFELHFNAASPAATGTETIYLEPNGRLAGIVNRAMVQALGLKDRGAKPPWNGRGEGNLRAAKGVPAVIVEPGFGSNPHDSARMQERKVGLARALLGAFTQFTTED